MSDGVIEAALLGFEKLIVRRVADGDEFIANLWKIHCRVKEEGYVQASSLMTLIMAQV